MISPFLYWLLIIFEFLFVFTMALYMLFLIYSSLMGSPYVASKKNQLSTILREIPFSKKMKFLDLGCGDGRVVMSVAKEYGIEALGVDINPMIIAWAKFKTQLAQIPTAKYKVENIFKTNLVDFDVIYLFLMPKLLLKLKRKLQKETKNGVLIISHGFKIDGWEKYCFKTLNGRPFNTYFYRLSK
jgi:ribosomal protein L11 methylase PrmA